MARLLDYDRRVQKAESDASVRFRSSLALWLERNPDATDAEADAAALEIALGLLPEYGSAAAVFADDLCLELAGQEGVRGRTTIDYEPDRDAVAEGIGSVDHGPAFVHASSDAVADEVHRAANDQMARSGEALGAREFALVPMTDSKTCMTCVGRAARGFYRPAKGAASLAKTHEHCRCKVVPAFGDHPEVEGRDPSSFQEAYDLGRRLLADGYSHAQVRRAMAGEPVGSLGPPNSGVGGRPRKPAVDPERRAEVARQLGLDDNDENRWAIELDLSLRDERWLAGGPAPGITYAPGAEESKRRKGNPKLFTKEHEVERGTVRLSAALGYASEFQEDEIPNPDPEDAKRRPVVGLPDLSSGMEVKTLRDTSSYNTVAKHVANAKKKGAVSVLLDYSGNSSLSVEKIDSITDMALARKDMKHALVIYPDGSFSVKTRK